MHALRNYNLAVIGLLILAFGVRAAAGVWWQERQPAGSDFAFGDSFSYWNLARVTAAGEPYEYANSRVFRAPGYPLMLSPLFWLRPDPPVVWARWLGAVLGAAAVGGVIALGQQMFDRRVALLAGALTAIYPGAIGMSVFILSEAPFCPFMLMQLACWAAADRAASGAARTGYAIVGGIAAGAANLIRPSWILFTLAAACYAWCCGKRSRHHVRIALIMLVATSVTMSPWWIRNYRVVGAFVPTTLEIGASLYDGLNPQATGASDMRFVEDFRAEHLAQDPADQESLAYEVRLDRAMRDAALRWARAHPGRVLELALIKFRRMWSPAPNAAELRSSRFRWLTAAGYLPLLLGAIGGAVVYLRRGFLIWLCILPALYFTALHVIFVSSIRYRQPAMLPLIVLAAALIGYVWPPPPDRNSSEPADL